MAYQKLKEANDKFAFEELKKDADKGHLFCQHQVAMMYENGIGTDKNSEKAFEYYEKAANRGHVISQICLGGMYEHGIGKAKNLKKAFEYYEKAADNSLNSLFEFDKFALKIYPSQGNTQAQHHLGYMYQFGIGTAKNLQKAFEYYEKASNQGYTHSQYNLGIMYEKGTGTSKNLEKAFEYYEKSANQGHVHSQNRLGYMYQFGIGIAKNLEKSLEYYEKAANQEDPAAKIEIEKYSSSKCKKIDNSAAQITQPIQPIAVKRPFILDMSESSVCSSAKKQVIVID